MPALPLNAKNTIAIGCDTDRSYVAVHTPPKNGTATQGGAMRKQLILWALVGLIATNLVATQSAHAQVSKDSLSRLRSGCSNIKDFQPVYSNDGQIRAEYLTYCETKSGDRYIFFEAAAMHNYSFAGNSQSPWMYVDFVDQKGKSLNAKHSIAFIVDVPNCGGYQFHMHRVATANWAAQIYDARFSVGNTSGVDCTPTPSLWRDAIKTAAAIAAGVEDCSTSKLNTNEQDICRFLKKNAGQFLTK